MTPTPPREMRWMYGLLLVAAFAWPGLQAQPRYGTSIFIQASQPTVGSYPGSMWFDTSVDTLKIQKSDLSWASVGGSGGGLPSGAIVMVDTGACPTGTTEVSAMDGKMPFGTTNAHADVGGTGGNDSITPAGSVAAPVFTGTALATHLHAFGTIAVAAHTVVATKQGTAAGNVVTTATHTVSGSTAAITAGTPAGTNSAPAFTGTAFDNRSAYRKTIFCKAN